MPLPNDGVDAEVSRLSSFHSNLVDMFGYDAHDSVPASLVGATIR